MHRKNIFEKKINNKKPQEYLTSKTYEDCIIHVKYFKGLKTTLIWFCYLTKKSFFKLIILVCSYIILATSNHHCMCDKNPRMSFI